MRHPHNEGCRQLVVLAIVLTIAAVMLLTAIAAYASPSAYVQPRASTTGPLDHGWHRVRT